MKVDLNIHWNMLGGRKHFKRSLSMLVLVLRVRRREGKTSGNYCMHSVNLAGTLAGPIRFLLALSGRYCHVTLYTTDGKLLVVG